MKLIILLFTILMLESCSTETESDRGKYLGDGSTSDGGTDTGTDDGEDQPVLGLTDLYLFMADDLKGKIDAKVAFLDSSDVAAGSAEVLNDNGLTAKLIPAFMTQADQDTSGDLSYAEFLDATVVKDGEEEAVKASVTVDKQTIYDIVTANFGDFAAPMTADELLVLIKVRVWVLRNWTTELSSSDPDRLKLLIKTGYDDLHALVGSTYNTGELTEENFNALSAGITAELSK